MWLSYRKSSPQALQNLVRWMLIVKKVGMAGGGCRMIVDADPSCLMRLMCLKKILKGHAMKAIRQIGSLAFVLGLFVSVFAGIPWRVVVSDDPTVPLWLQIAIFCLLGGILVVLGTLACEQKRFRSPASDDAAAEGDTGGSILLLNSDTVPSRDVTDVLGLVQGHTVFAVWIGKDLSAIVRLLLGGELTEYTEMMGAARSTATARMTAQAAELGADAIINVRYMTTSVVGTAAELLVYGTAVKLHKPVSVGV
jgi:uncharacterized protein YbjQ (UPF0145 family)